MPARVRAQAISDVRMIFRIADGFRQQSVFGRHLVQRRRGQRLHEKLGAGSDAALNAGHHRIEIVERAERTLTHGAALRRIRIDVFEMFEPFRIFDVAEQRQRVAPSSVASAPTPAAATIRRQMRPSAGATNVDAVARKTDRRLSFMQLLRHNYFRYAVAGNYVAFSVPASDRPCRQCRSKPQISVTKWSRKTQRPGEGPADSTRCTGYFLAGSPPAGGGAPSAALGSGTGLSARVCR